MYLLLVSMRSVKITVRPPGGKISDGLFGRKYASLQRFFYGCINMAINVQAAPCVNRLLEKPKRILFGIFPRIAVTHGKGKK